VARCSAKAVAFCLSVLAQVSLCSVSKLREQVDGSILKSVLFICSFRIKKYEVQGISSCAGMAV